MASASISGTWDSGTATASGTWSCEVFYPSTITYPGGSSFKSSSGTYSGSWGPIAHAAGATVTYSVSSPVANASTTISAASSPPSGGGTTVSVPNIVGQTEDAAEATILAAGLGVTFTQTTSGATKLNHGTVKSQNPTAGSSVAPGTTVNAEVFLFPNWFNLAGALTSNDGTAPGAYPGIWYYVETKNDFNLNAQVSWSISNTSLSGSQVVTPFNQFLWAPPSAAHLSASYATTYTLTVTAQALSSGGVPINPVETRNFQVTTPPVPVVAPSWSDNTLSSDFRVGEAYSDSVSASGTAPITYSVSAGSLPDGITRTGGALSGTPTTAGPYSFTISATNSAGSISASFSGTVGGPKGGLYVFDGTNWIQSTANVLNGSGGSAEAQVWFYNGTTWIKSF